MTRLENDRRTFESTYKAAKPKSAPQTAAQKAAAARTAAQAAEKRRLAAADAEQREQLRREPTHTPEAWAAVRMRAQGKAPLAAPLRGALESRRSEFDHFAQVARQRGAEAPWENLRAAQLCLMFQGSGAEPSRALEFVARSDPAWPEVQFGLGLCYLRGYGVEADPTKARHHLEQAARPVPAADQVAYSSSGELLPDSVFQAARELAVAYDLGLGLPADPTQAGQCYARARSRPLKARDHDELAMLQREFWKRHAKDARALLEQEFLLAKAGAVAVNRHTLFQGLAASGNAQALYEVGALLDTHDLRGEPLPRGRGGMSYFLVAARLGHEAAARAYFSPAANGFYDVAFDENLKWEEVRDFTRDEWPAWERKWQAAAANGDAAANIPLALYYSGARGNPADRQRAKRHAALMPTTMSPAQRDGVNAANVLAEAGEKERWAATVFAKFGARSDTIDLSRLAQPPDPERGAALREEGIALASDQVNQARDHWRDAAALGDLSAQVQLFIYAKRHDVYLGAYQRSLRQRLEAAAVAADAGAIASLAVLLDGRYHNRLRLSSAGGSDGEAWRDRAVALAPARARYFQIAQDPALTDEQCAAAREAAARETEKWQTVARSWGLEGTDLTAELTLSEEEFRQVDAQRAQLVALATAARQLAERLPLWQSTVETAEFDPESDARFIQGYEAWQGHGKTERDVAVAIDYYAQSTGLGNPMAPIVLAYFFGSGHAGFPPAAELSRRFRALGEARLTALAEDDNRWAQTILGSLLLEKHDRRDTAANQGAYEWLPQDQARGIKWLQVAAANGATLPPNFGDSRGQTVAWYLSQRYYEEKNPPACAKWAVIDEVFREQLTSAGTTDEAWEGALASVRNILTESPTAEKERAELDQTVREAGTDAEQAAARGRRAEALNALGLRRLALRDAEHAARIAIESPAAWRILAALPEADGQKDEAELSRSMVQSLEDPPNGLRRFETAFAKVGAERQESIQAFLGFTLEEQPQHAALKQLKASADRIYKPKKE